MTADTQYTRRPAFAWKMPTARSLTALSLVLMVSCSPAVALQRHKRDKTIVGTVTDRHAHRLWRAHVILKQSRTERIHSYLTDRHGRYHFRHVKAATDYQVWARYKGHDSSKQWISRYDSHRLRHADLVIEAP